MEFFSHQTNFRFMATRHVWYGLSAILMVAAVVLLFTRGLNLAIDFTGGVSAQATFPVTADLGAVRRQLVSAGFGDAQVQNFGSSRNIAVRLPPSKMNQEVLREHIEAALKAVNPGGDPATARGRGSAGRQRARDERGRGARFHAARHLHLHRRPLPYLAALVGSDPRGHTRSDPRARLVCGLADVVRSGRGRCDARRHRLLAERHGGGVRQDSGALREQPPAAARMSCSISRSTRRCREPS